MEIPTGSRARLHLFIILSGDIKAADISEIDQKSVILRRRSIQVWSLVPEAFGAI